MTKLLIGVFAVAGILGVLSGCASSHPPKTQVDSPGKRLASYVGDLERVYPGFAFGATDGNEAGLIVTTGMANIDAGHAIGVRTPMYMFSLTKVFTSLAVLQLAERGLVSLDAPIREYLPWVPYEGTVRHVLSHTAGIPDPIWGTFYIHAEGYTPEREVLLKETVSRHPEAEFAPGDDVRYTNLGYAILGALIEEVTDQSWERYLADSIFAPLEMESTGASPGSFESVATSYITRSAVTRLLMRRMIPWLEFHRHGSFVALEGSYAFDLPAHGGLITTPSDLNRFARAVLLRDERLLGEQWWSAWMEPQSDAGGLYALGWRAEQTDRGLLLHHWGGAMGHSAFLRVYVEAGVATFGQTNVLNTRRLERRDVASLDELAFEALQHREVR